MTEFTTTKPTLLGVYQVRGWRIGHPRMTAVVSVEQNAAGELVCNLHENNSETDLEEWDLLANFADDFEWRGPQHYITAGERIALTAVLADYYDLVDETADEGSAYKVLEGLRERLKGDGP